MEALVQSTPQYVSTVLYKLRYSVPARRQIVDVERREEYRPPYSARRFSASSWRAREREITGSESYGRPEGVNTGFRSHSRFADACRIP